MKRVYLAGPMVFWPDAAEIFAEMRSMLGQLDLEGVAPIDNQMGLEQLQPGDELNRAIYRADVEIMDRADAAIFNIAPFRRGTEMDAGTAFEVGYCACRRIPLAGWTTDPRTYPEIVRSYFDEVFGTELVDAHRHQDRASSGLSRDPDGILVHSSGLHQNLMIEVAIETAGGLVAANPNWRIAFASAAQSLRKQLSGQDKRPTRRSVA